MVRPEVSTESVQNVQRALPLTWIAGVNPMSGWTEAPREAFRL
jgi:hypothetical protein